MKSNQVIVTRCLICDAVFNCFDNYRNPQKCECVACNDICPLPTQPDSHGFCEKHFQEAMANIRQRHLEGV